MALNQQRAQLLAAWFRKRRNVLEARTRRGAGCWRVEVVFLQSNGHLGLINMGRFDPSYVYAFRDRV